LRLCGELIHLWTDSNQVNWAQALHVGKVT
jgi:hypothetical protein